MLGGVHEYDRQLNMLEQAVLKQLQSAVLPDPLRAVLILRSLERDLRAAGCPFDHLLVLSRCYAGWQWARLTTLVRITDEDEGEDHVRTA